MANEQQPLRIQHNELVTTTEQGEQRVSIFSTEGFSILNELWLRSGWHHKLGYTFTWWGVPIIQLADDVMRMQELIFQLQPDVIIETGVARGGSMVFYASLCRLLNKGRVIGIDIDIRPHTHTALDAHPLRSLITLIQGSSVDPVVVAQVQAQVQTAETVLVILDSNHSYEHVLAELIAYAPLVTVNSYLIATDGLMELVAHDPRGQASWTTDNPQRATQTFLQTHPEFRLETPTPLFQEGNIQLAQEITHWQGAYLKRLAV